MNTAPIRVGIIGLGRMGRNHLRVLSSLKGVEIGFIFDLDRAAAATAAGDLHSLVVDSPETGLAQVDAVVIASPTTTHDHYVRIAAEHRCALFVEKPLSDDLASSLALRDLLLERKIQAQIGFIERFNPAVVQLKRLLDHSPQVVSIDFARTNRVSARITDVDVVTDLMIHDINLALFFNGPVEEVNAHGLAHEGMIDFASASIKHRNGRLSRIQASRITDKKVRMIQVTCVDMFVDCDLLRKEITLSRQSEVLQVPGEPYRITGVEERIEVFPHEALVGELQAFLRDVRAGERSIDIPGADEAVDAMAVCEHVRRSILGD